MEHNLDKTYGYYDLNAILCIASSRRARDVNAIIKGIISAEYSDNPKKPGFKYKAIELIKSDFIKKYGQDKFKELTETSKNNIHEQFEGKFVEDTDQFNIESWGKFIDLYNKVFPIVRNSKNSIEDFNISSKQKLLHYYEEKDKFYAIALANYVLSKAKDINAYIHKDGIGGKYYIHIDDAKKLQVEYEKKKNLEIVQNNLCNDLEANHNLQKELEKDFFIKWNKVFNNLPNEVRTKYSEKAMKLIEEFNLKEGVIEISTFLYTFDQGFKEEMPKNLKLISCIAKFNNIT